MKMLFREKKAYFYIVIALLTMSVIFYGKTDKHNL
jgi:hypothetical protein